VNDLVRGDDGLARCPWGVSAPEYVAYHDTEWGRPRRGDDAMFERLTLEAFQSGLSWLTILRKREAFRAAFDGFSIQAVARFGDRDVERLMADAGIVRNRAKITATVANARVAAGLPEGLSALLWSFQPMRGTVPRRIGDVPAVTAESTALAGELKGRGFRFVGPTTAYALMQAVGMVNDHLEGCHARSGGIELLGESTDDPVEVVAPDPQWPAWFARVRDQIVSALGPAVRVEHVGSTSVPGLAAKPVLDVQVSVPDLDEESAFVPGRESLGVVLRGREPGHRYLRTPPGVRPRVHVHVCATGSDWERDHLLFPAYLRAHPERRDAYAALKRDLAERFRTDRLAYTMRKTRFVEDTLALARATPPPA
jgi:DNA-3-methyladenine glycosylase I